MTAHPLQVVFLCRFSYLGTSHPFQSHRGDIAARRRALHDFERLALRLFFFEHVMLPPLRAQTDRDFTLLVLIGTDLPAAVRLRLEEVLSDLPQARIETRAPGPARKIYAEVLRGARQPGRRQVAEVRMDDDDAVATDFVSRLRDRAGGSGPEAPFVVDFNKGLILSLGAGGVDLTPVHARYWTPAMAMIVPTGSPASLFDVPHFRIWSRMPTLTWPEPVMFVRGEHSDNDSAVNRQTGATFELAPDSGPAVLKDRFAIDLDGLVAAWREAMG